MDAEIPGFRKTFMYLETSPGERSCCSLVLRGASSEKLKIVKQVVDLMVFVVYSLKLETSLLQDKFALTPNAVPDPEYVSLKDIKTRVTDPIDRAIKLFECTILSGSPMVTFPPPCNMQLITDLLLKLKSQEQGQILLNNAMPLAPMEVKPTTSNAKPSELLTHVESTEDFDKIANVDTSFTIPLGLLMYNPS
jgi:hypothetical protein